jgi:hypothetical protein
MTGPVLIQTPSVDSSTLTYTLYEYEGKRYTRTETVETVRTIDPDNPKLVRLARWGLKDSEPYKVGTTTGLESANDWLFDKAAQSSILEER